MTYDEGDQSRRENQGDPDHEHQQTRYSVGQVSLGFIFYVNLFVCERIVPEARGDC